MKFRAIQAFNHPRKIAVFGAALLLALSLLGATLLTGSPTHRTHAQGTPPTTQQIAQEILSKAYLTGSAESALEMLVHGDRQLPPDSNEAGIDPSKAKHATGGHPSNEQSVFTNVRVNNPAEDSTFIDQTTQSEPSIAVSGKHIVVGFNDSQTNLIAPTSGGNLDGVAYSTDGGKSFVDGGALPNAPGAVNLGDPWLSSDSAGNFYYSTLLYVPFRGLNVGVAKSTDGGKSWSLPVVIPPPAGTAPFHFADKDALTAGPGVSTLYDSWDDETAVPINGPLEAILSDLAIAHSTDGGQTWTTVYADQVPLFDQNNPCSFQQYIGAQPLVGPDGTVYDAALKLSVNDPNCTGTVPLTESEWIFVSHDGGATFPQKVKIADVTPSAGGPGGAGFFTLGTGQYMRTIEFPTLAFFGGSLYAAWMDGGDGSGHTHIRLAKSSDGGQSWSTSFVTSGLNDEVQPALSGDSSGLHLLYYEISPLADGTSVLDVFVANSSDGANFTPRRVTTQSFPGVFTFPPFDPIITGAYMGDYISNVSDGTHQYFVWGDNRDIVTNLLWPNGRNDPDVFFAKQ